MLQALYDRLLVKLGFNIHEMEAFLLDKYVISIPNLQTKVLSQLETSMSPFRRPHLILSINH